MLNLDIPTLLVVVATAEIFGALAVLALWLENRQTPGLRLLLAALGSAMAWAVLRSLEGVLPAGVGITSANFFLVFTFVGLVEATHRFYGGEKRWGWLVAAVAAIGGLLAWWTLGDDDLQARVRLVSLLIAASGIAGAVIAWRGLERSTRTGTGLIIFGFAALALGGLPRGLLGQDFLSSTPLNLAILLAILLALISCIFGVFLVISGRHLATAERLRQEAQRNERGKAAFLAVMSHEIRTPMNGVLGLSELLIDTELDSQQRQLALSIRSSGRILLRILDDILDLSKIDAGRLELERVRFNVRDLIAELHHLIREPAQRKNLTFGTDVAADVPASVTGDPGRLGQILLNLLSNAVKFTEKGHVILRVVAGDRDQIFCEVEDTGVGLTAEEQSRIFRDFEQSNSSTSRRYGGTGLGLSISQQLAGLMGGHIEIDSTPGEGSTFRLGLPLPEADESLPETDEISLRQIFFDELGADSSPEPSRHRELRVLVAEDDPVSQLVASGMLEGLGVECHLVPDGEAALSALGDGSYDLVFMDCQMPKLDGFETVRRWRALEDDQERLPIIALTAGVMVEERQRCLESGMDDVLAKPVSTSGLAEVIERWLNVSLS